MPRRRWRRSSLAFLVGALVSTLVLAGCEDDVVGVGGLADVSGFWSGQYVVTGCTLSGAAVGAFCTDDFPIRASLILEMDLSQEGADVFGVMGQGTLQGDVDGFVDDFGLLFLTGVLGSDTLTTSEILAWQTGLVGDSLVGSWRFRVDDHAGRGFGTATVDGNMRLLGPTVLKLFGCPVEDELLIGSQLSGNLQTGDCEFADASLFDVFSFRGSAGDSVEIAVRSPAFDAFLIITDTDEQELGADDDSGGGANGTDAAIVIAFDEAGTVLLAANSSTAGQSGPYTITATRLLPAAPVVAGRAPARGTGRGGRGGGFRVIGGDSVERLSEKLAPRLLRRVGGSSR